MTEQDQIPECHCAHANCVEQLSEDMPLVQLVIGGRNKYLINGHVAQPTYVSFTPFYKTVGCVFRIACLPQKHARRTCS